MYRSSLRLIFFFCLLQLVTLVGFGYAGEGGQGASSFSLNEPDQQQPVCASDSSAPVIVYPAGGLQASLEGCDFGQPAIFFFSITVADDCDETPDYSLEQIAGPTGGLQLYHPFGNHYVAIAQPGAYELLVQASDEAGNTSTASFAVNVEQAPPPGTNYACNDTLIVYLDGDCQRELTPEMVLEGAIGCSPEEYFDIDVFDALPDNGPIVDGAGTYNYELNPVQPSPISGFSGTFAAAHWSISERSGAEVAIEAGSLELSGGPDESWAAALYAFGQSGQIAFSWGLDLSTAVGAADFELRLLNADGSIDFERQSSATTVGSVNLSVTPGQVLWVSLRSDGGAAASLSNWSASFSGIDTSALFSCWGVVQAFDQEPPQLDCPPDTDMAVRFLPAQELTGEIRDDSPLIEPTDYSCLTSGFSGSGDRHYDVLRFEVSTDDVYTFLLSANLTAGGAQLALFQGGFSALSPCSNIIALAGFPPAGSPIGSLAYARLSLPLRVGQAYYLVTIADLPDATGPYNYRVLSDGDGSIAGAAASSLRFEQTLFCADLAFISATDSVQWTGLPVVADNCGEFSLSFTQVSEEQGDCGPLRLRRTFKAADESGNSSSCEQVIDFRRPGVEDIVLPPANMPIECDEDFPTDAQGYPSPVLTGYPFVLTVQGVRDLRQTYCNLGAAYEDSPMIATCEDSYQFVRTWRITDWCAPTNTFNYTQVIKIGDFTAPEITCRSAGADTLGQDLPLHYTTQPFNCSAAFMVPLPEVFDNCSDWEVHTELVTYTDSILYGPSGLPIDTVAAERVLAVVPANATNRFVSGIPLGCHWFRYTVTDACGNASLKECAFCVVDETAPVAVCNDNLNVSLDSNGEARLRPNNVNDDSWDNCGIGLMLLRRQLTLDGDCMLLDDPFYTPWSEHVAVSCCDIGHPVLVELLVIDESGNENTCWTELIVEDKLRPQCVPPAEVVIPCDSVPAGFQAGGIAALQALFGEPTVSDNCSALWEELPPNFMLDNCGIGRIIRNFRAVDLSGNISSGSCTQEVRITASHNYEIKFPKDAEALCALPNPDTIEIAELACDLLAVSVSDTLFAASGEECYKIFRTYRVINWCEYDGFSPPVVVGRDEDCDGQPGDEAVWVLRRPDQAYIDRDDDHTNAFPFEGEKGSSCDGASNPDGYWRKANSNGYWAYTQHIKVYDDVPPVIEFVIPLAVCSNNNETCRASAEYLFAVIENCTPNDLTIEIYYDEYADGTVDSVITDIFGAYPKWKIAGDWPIGMHEFEIRVEDGCGNSASAVMPFEIVDCKAPTPTCINGLSGPLMPVPPDTDVDGDGLFDRGALTVFAEDFVASPYVDCSMPLTYSINRAGEQPSIDQEALILTCADLGVVVVEIHAWDAADNPYAVLPDGSIGGPNHSFCETFIVVTNNLADCEGEQPLIAGAVAREDSVAVPGVNMQLSGLINRATTTDSSGRYAFEQLQPGYDYTVTPSFNDPMLNGLTTFDVLLISQHILGIKPLTSPYQLIAADVNGSGSVSTLDMILLRQLILSVITEIPGSPSWRFVPRSHIFANPADPWAPPFPEAMNYNDLYDALPNEDYVAIKIGDMDLSAQVNPFQQLDDRRAYPGWESIWIEDRYLAAGESVLVPVYADLGGLLGLQGCLELDKERIALEGVVEGLWDEAYYRAVLSKGRLYTSWSSNTPYEGKQLLYYLRLRARAPVRLADVLTLRQDGQLLAEAYTTELEKLGLRLQFASPAGEEPGLRVYPNPFSVETLLQFEQAEAGDATLSVFSSDGRLLLRRSQFFGLGQSEWVLAAEDLLGSGVYYLQLTTGQSAWSKRVVLIK